MRAFACSACRRLVTFESSLCLHRGAELAFDPGPHEIVGLRFTPDPDDGEALEALGTDDAVTVRWRCANAVLIGCNWLAEVEDGLCPSCALTRARPADDDERGLEQLASAERSKRRLLFQLLELELPIVSGRDNQG